MVKRIGTLSLLLLCSVLAFAAVGCAPMVPDPYVYRTAGEFGSAGTAAGQFAQPSGVAVDPTGNVYVADAHNHRIQKFSAVGVHMLSWGTLGSGAGQFTYPRGVAVDSAGNVYVADTNNHRIQKFSSAGVHVLSWGTEGSGAGQFAYPRGVAVDVDGNV
ncbi:MAG: SBBP repeat-containing protein [Coriobacteriia bacterium]|nr:SBBP repeat-containing protein [Coriobacteriia bacterium]